jgi:hypothetical protein
MRKRKRKLTEFLADPGHWAGYVADPAETTRPIAWLYIGRLEIYVTTPTIDWTWRPRR